MKKIKKAVKKVLRKINGKVNFKSLSAYLNLLEYIVQEYDSETPNDFLINNNLAEYCKNVNAFTYRLKNTKIVFIKSELSTEEKLYSLSHETGHIVLKHLINNEAKNPRFLEMEAETFSHMLLTYKPNKYRSALIVSIIISITLSVIGVMYYLNAFKADNNTVYITSSGTCYHRRNCIYLENSTSTVLTELEAKKDYAPCKVCKP